MKYLLTGFIFFLVLANTSPLISSENVQKQDCSCQKISWQQAFEQSEHVVFGEVREVKVHNDDLATGIFQAMETFKGDETFIKQLVGSAKKAASCRKVLSPGYYIVYTSEAENVVLNPCVASRQLEDDLVQTLTQIKHYADNKAGALEPPASQQKQTTNGEKSWLQSIIDWFEE